MIVNLSSYTYGSQNDENIPDSLSLFNKNVTELKRVFGDIPNIVVGDENPEDIASTLENGTVYIYIGEPVLTAESIGAIPSTSLGAPGGVATLDENGRLQGEQACSNVVEHYNITNYTMSTNDVGKAHLFTMPSGSQATITVMLPDSFPIGTEFEILKGNIATTIIVVSAGNSVTILTINRNEGSSISAGSGKYALITLKRYGQPWWYATGADE